MAAPLRSENSEPQKSMQFAHFGVLNDGAQSKTSTATALILNVTIVFVLLVLTAASAKHAVQRRLLTELAAPIPVKKIEPVRPKIVPPKLKPLEIAKVELPKIVIPEIKTPEPPKPVVKMDEPKPVVAPPAPKQVIAKAAPVAVSLAHPTAASVPNNDAHPTAVRLGASDSPVNNIHGPAVAPVNMGRGMPGMNSANNGNGPKAAKVDFGNGSANSTSIKGNGVASVVGLGHGVTGGTGNRPGREQVSLGGAPPPPAGRVQTASLGQAKPPVVISKPKPDYTEEAKQKHIEGVVSLHIRVLANGEVQVIGITQPLGYGLDESARRAILATRFHPATDSAGAAIAWDGVVKVTFQLAG